MGTVEGIFSFDDNTVYCEVLERDFDGFLGDDVDYFDFWAESTDEGLGLTYLGDDIGVTTYGDVFS
jgi:hypothetical protein